MIYNLKVELDYERKFDYIRYQNGLDKIRKITIYNEGEETVRGLRLVMTSIPEFSQAWLRNIDEIPAKQSMVVGDVNLIVDPELLMKYNEAQMGNLIVEIFSGDDMDNPVYKTNFQVDLLPFDLMHFNEHEELLASFVTPNDRRVLEIVAKAGERLGNKDGIALAGYHSVDETLKVMRVIYEVIQEENISYCLPPANWSRGQRVRMPGFTLANKLGCCIDMAVLYASCLEAVRLNALVLVTHNHAIAGCWLKDTMFDEAVVRDRETVETRSFNKLKELAFVECTWMDTYAHKPDFLAAVNCTDKNYPNFEFVLDVKRARDAGIRPIALPEVHDDMSTEDNGLQMGSEQGEETDDYYDNDDLEILPDLEEEELTKMAYWEHKILDTTMRNNLVSMTFGKSMLPLMLDLDSLPYITAGLMEGRSYHLLPAPGEVEKVPEAKDVDTQTQIIRKLRGVTNGDLNNGRLRVLLTEKETLSRLKNVYKNANNFIEESGANVLYLGTCFLKWRQKKDAKVRYAPLMLIPVNLERKSANTDYTLSLREDEWQMNTTLFLMLKDKFGVQVPNVEAIPLIDGEIKYKALIGTVRSAIKQKAGWDVVERAVLGTFSFGQFMMWQDLHTHADLFSERPIVDSLQKGHMSWTMKEGFLSRQELDLQQKPSQLVLPISADGSQMTAIEAASKGESFVMHGPPGTGKSQTITNIIANALYNDKTVLFLAKKMPALEVVQKRLEEIGLGPFCLELHGNKASRQHVLNQFKETMNLAEQKHQELYERTSDQVMEIRQELRHLVESLHTPTACGYSLYELMGLLETYAGASDSIHFDQATAMAVTPAQLNDWRLQLNTLEQVLEQLPDIAEHPLKGIWRPAFSREEKMQLKEKILSWQDQKAQLLADIAEMKQVTEIDETQMSIQDSAAVANILAHVPVYSRLLSKLLTKYEIDEILEACEDYEEIRESMDRISDYKRSVLKLDLADYRDTLNTAGRASRMGLFGRNPKTAARKEIVKTLSTYIKNKSDKKLTEENVEDELKVLLEVKEVFDDYAGRSEVLKALLTNDGNINPKTWRKKTALLELLLDQLDSLDIDDDTYEKLESYIREQSCDPDESFKDDQAWYQEIVQTYQDLKTLGDEIREQAAYTYTGDSTSELYFSQEWEEILQSWLDNYHDLDSWCFYTKERETACQMGLAPVVEAIESGIQADELIPAFYKAWASVYVRKTVKDDPALQYFNGLSYDQAIRKYRELASEFEQMSRNEIVARLYDRLPDRNMGTDSKDFGMLQKAIMGGGQKLTIRQLFNQMPDAVRTLAPCMLMSPASVAQFIDPSFPQFDLVIIDEASQMPTCEAVGALARGKSVIIAGDEQQLPPTSFFKKKEISGNLQMDDLESILDDALALNMPQCYLSWHYRSAHESLIAFSNMRYYDAGLRTFPSVDDQRPAITCEKVDGIYDRSGTRTNEVEADAIVAEMARRLKEKPEESVGVISFNIQQSGLIEEKWEALLDQDEELRQIAQDQETKVFIKNLENIQGDERDVILFSIGYGPDAEGKMAMNFGPVNQSGGHRRLNVAITRAKKEMKVFVSFTSADIRVTRSSAQGMRDLKDFLAYAEHGYEALEQFKSQVTGEKARINQQIADALAERGYQVKTNVGTSSFKVDVAVCDPENPDKYLLGIIFDDDSKAMEDTIKDRVILQKNVMKRMGWKLLNLWLLDWWSDRESQIQRIIEAVEAAKA